MTGALPDYRNGQTAFATREDVHNVLVVTRGHGFARDAFFQMFEQAPNLEWANVEHPAAQLLFNPEAAAHFDCYVLYDMPGIEFIRTGEGGMRMHEPPEFYREGLLAMLEQGTPLVILHHACAAWPSWPLWAEIVGARFLYQSGPLRGKMCPDSGYRHGVRHTISPTQAHPVTDGIAPFELVDELYLFEVFEDEVVPLLQSDFSFSAEHFYSAQQAIHGRMDSNEGWQHAPGSALIGWIKHYANSPIVYLQCGDGPEAYANASLRKLLYNAIDWACSEHARQWVRQRQASLG